MLNVINGVWCDGSDDCVPIVRRAFIGTDVSFSLVKENANQSLAGRTLRAIIATSQAGAVVATVTDGVISKANDIISFLLPRSATASIVAGTYYLEVRDIAVNSQAVLAYGSINFLGSPADTSLSNPNIVLPISLQLGGSGANLSAAGPGLMYLEGNNVAAEVVTIGSGLSLAGSAGAYTLASNAGTVTSVALSLPAIFTVSGSPVTAAGTLAATLATQAANMVWAGPTSGGAAVPDFRLLAAADIPKIAENQVTNLVIDLAGKQATGNYITALTGDATASGPGSVALTLATVNSNVGSFGTASSTPTITLNAKGQVTAASNTPIQIVESQVTSLVGDLAAKVPATRQVAGHALTGDVSIAAADLLNGVVGSGAVTLKTYVDNAVAGLGGYQGAIDCSGNPNYPAATANQSWRVSVSGKIGGNAGIQVDAGDLLICIATNAGGTQAAVGSSWLPVEHNLVGVLLAANNLSDVDAVTARTNLGVPAGSGTSTGVNTGDETATSIGALINAAASKATPVDSDQLGLMDSAAANVLNKLSWANAKATLKAYFDSLYQAVGTYLTPSSTNTLTNKRVVPRVNTVSNPSSPFTVDVDAYDAIVITGLSHALTFAVSGTPTDRQSVTVTVYAAAGVNQALTWWAPNSVTGFVPPGHTAGSAGVQATLTYDAANTRWETTSRFPLGRADATANGEESTSRQNCIPFFDSNGVLRIGGQGGPSQLYYDGDAFSILKNGVGIAPATLADDGATPVGVYISGPIYGGTTVVTTSLNWAGENRVIFAGIGGGNITLPDAATWPSGEIDILVINFTAPTITFASAATFTLLGPGFAKCVSDGTNWHVVSTGKNVTAAVDATSVTTN